MENSRFKFRVWKQDNWGYNIKNEFVKQKPHYEYFELNNNNIVFHKNDITEQYTGLKDKNGKLIYENDYIKGRYVYHKVCWDDKKARFIIQNMKYKEYCCGIDQEFIDEIGLEIIGNIHENKDLLDSKNE